MILVRVFQSVVLLLGLGLSLYYGHLTALLFRSVASERSLQQRARAPWLLGLLGILFSVIAGQEWGLSKMTQLLLSLSVAGAISMAGMYVSYREGVEEVF